MANATVKRGVAPIESVTLELTLEEAQFLRSLLGEHVIGTGLRCTLSDPIHGALARAGIGCHSNWTGEGPVKF
jgi:hypothetical protein